MKFAYLIIVHTRFDQVAKLLELLDDEKNDLYVHIDEKVANSFDIFQRTLKPSVQKSKIYLVNPHNVTWGGKSQIEAELELLKAAIKGNYDYYHLISGMDLPIKTQKEIHEFFENNKGKEFIHFSTNEDARKRCQYYWLYQEKLGNVAKAGILKKHVINCDC
ncbi:MAG: beta-1,6-N-acetylglucosaminyltransferase [Blautia massiliensis (ex Durand et al. 2017)]